MVLRIILFEQGATYFILGPQTQRKSTQVEDVNSKHGASSSIWRSKLSCGSVGMNL